MSARGAAPPGATIARPADRESLLAFERRAEKIARGSVTPLDERGELERPDLTLAGRLRPSGRDQAVHLPLHRLAFPPPFLKHGSHHLALLYATRLCNNLAEIWTKL